MMYKIVIFASDICLHITGYVRYLCGAGTFGAVLIRGFRYVQTYTSGKKMISLDVINGSATPFSIVRNKCKVDCTLP